MQSFVSHRTKSWRYFICVILRQYNITHFRNIIFANIFDLRNIALHTLKGIYCCDFFAVVCLLSTLVTLSCTMFLSLGFLGYLFPTERGNWMCYPYSSKLKWSIILCLQWNHTYSWIRYILITWKTEPGSESHHIDDFCFNPL